MLTIIATSVAAQPKPGCQTHCGNVTIPYPFGTGSAECYINGSFLISCNTSFDPPKAFLATTDIEVLHISVDGYLRIQYPVGYDCYNSSGSSLYLKVGFTLDKFFISHTRNSLTAIGCDTYAYVQGFVGRTYSTGCLSFCYDAADVVNGSCFGTGCCQTVFPKGVTDYRLSFDSYRSHSKVLSFNPCSYGFAVEDGAYNFSLSHFLDPNFSKRKFPIILDWTIGNESCREARMDPQNYACKENTTCIDPENGSGYLCKCVNGFQGNPYLSYGCQDINECDTLKPCSRICHNLVGSYNCSCPEGFEGDGRRTGTGCSPKAKPQFPILAVTLGICISLLFSLLCCSWVYLGVRQRKLSKLKQHNFQQNGGILLREKLSEREEYGDTAKIFTVKELKKATNNYNESRILGRGGQGTVYRGTLPDGRNVAIKRSTLGDQSQVQQFINEVIVLSQINHRNVVKLLGCCLETQVPLLVYEYVRNGNLFDHLHNADHASIISWENRLKIATEAAEAISYLHSAAFPPIIHRDIKLTNILLDENYNAKVSDFGSSRLVPLNKEQITTLVQGTLGLKAISYERPEHERNLSLYFASVMKEGRLLDIIDGRVVDDGNIEQLKEVATLARRCVRLKGEERPSMKEVASELQGLLAMEKIQREKGDLYEVESEELFYDLNNSGAECDGSSSTSIGPDSVKKYVRTEFYDAR
ncbi:hypothetical protein V6N11_042408 [Hibiscus sabdariffa]|uniref:Uncharacterized protein n=1 Tax=Hibiscus sabdariffa TaxID=183260 RepID=A0ABR2QWH4_9ROSI